MDAKSSDGAQKVPLYSLNGDNVLAPPPYSPD